MTSKMTVKTSIVKPAAAMELQNVMAIAMIPTTAVVLTETDISFAVLTVEGLAKLKIRRIGERHKRGEVERKTMNAEASMEMPKYRCHKVVHALKILEVIDPTKVNEESDGSLLLRVEHPFLPIRVDHAFAHKHKPQAGGYYVVYADDYKSFSPAEAFENGYTLI